MDEIEAEKEVTAGKTEKTNTGTESTVAERKVIERGKTVDTRRKGKRNIEKTAVEAEKDMAAKGRENIAQEERESAKEKEAIGKEKTAIENMETAKEKTATENMETAKEKTETTKETEVTETEKDTREKVKNTERTKATTEKAERVAAAGREAEGVGAEVTARGNVTQAAFTCRD